VPRKLRDFILTTITLVLLVAGMASLSPQLRERTVQMVTEPGWKTLRTMTTVAVYSGFGYVGDYADYHIYLFTFLVAACVFAVLMMRIIS
jgi:uncharacterized protein YjeT (DUF2065 family)